MTFLRVCNTQECQKCDTHKVCQKCDTQECQKWHALKKQEGTRACPQLSQISPAVRWMAARKLRAVLS